MNTSTAYIKENGQPPHKGRPSVLQLAQNALQSDLRIDNDGSYHLYRRGRWARVNLADVMKAANTVLAEQGFPQIDRNPDWVVKKPVANNNQPETV